MINITIGDNLDRVTIPMDPDTTIREAFEEQQINYSVGMNSLNGETLRNEDLDKTFREFGVTTSCTLLNVAKAQVA